MKLDGRRASARATNEATTNFGQRTIKGSQLRLPFYFSMQTRLLSFRYGDDLVRFRSRFLAIEAHGPHQFCLVAVEVGVEGIHQRYAARANVARTSEPLLEFARAVDHSRVTVRQLKSEGCSPKIQVLRNASISADEGVVVCDIAVLAFGHLDGNTSLSHHC